MHINIVIEIMRPRNIKMAIKFNILFIFTCCNGFATKIYKNISVTEHLKNERIKDICGKMDSICSSSFMQLCSVRMVQGRLQFKEFDNNCYLFLYNMCVYPGNEWAIKDVGSCKNLNLRRYAEAVEKTTRTEAKNTGATEQSADAVEAETEANIGPIIEDTTLTTDDTQVVDKIHDDASTGLTDNTELTTDSGVNDDKIEADENAEVTADADDNRETTTDETTAMTDDDSDLTDSTLKHALRTLPRTTYSVDDAPDGHSCPRHCPSVYFPVCVNINRGQGKYYRLLYFVNHCEADRHYCMYWETEYQPPPNEDYELVRPPSNAAWSYCAGNKYMNFATFAESAASLGHYGWLKGDQRAQHIMEPCERAPGFG